MIADMLFLAKSDNGLIVPRSEAVDLATEVRELFEFYDALAEDQGVRLELQGSGTVDGDRLMIRRAISNLLSNAINHTMRGDRVNVCIERADDGARPPCSRESGCRYRGRAPAARVRPVLSGRSVATEVDRWRRSRPGDHEVHRDGAQRDRARGVRGWPDAFRIVVSGCVTKPFRELTLPRCRRHRQCEPDR